MSAKYISLTERRNGGGSAKTAAKNTKPVSSRFKSRDIIRAKNNYLDIRRKDLGVTLDSVMANQVTEATGLKCTPQFVGRFRNNQVPKIQSEYALGRNNIQKQYTPNAVDLLMQKWERGMG